MELKLDSKTPISGPDFKPLWGESGPMEFSNVEPEFDDYGQRIPPCVSHAKESDELEELEYIRTTLGYVEEEGLIPEVVFQALKEMKMDPTLSPSEALQFGYSEWIK